MKSAAPSSAPGMVASEQPPLEVPLWLKSLPLAPEFHPTLQEFQDPIAYILKIEKEAAPFGICKIVPPLPASPKKTAIANLNRSFAARNPAGGGRKPPSFTTRQQQIGFCPRRPRPVQKPVWQSGERYTLQQFEAKARQFERSHLRRAAGRKAAAAPDALSPLEVEALFWRASADKPLSVEYANDMPGSGFAPLTTAGRRWREEVPTNVGESAWNMRGVSRGKSSLLRFMKEEIPGVTSPMVYVAMLFSWFAWHVEDHELHSLNYLHMGAGKTWYGVPRDAGLAFEQVVRFHGYGGEVNPVVTFAILSEKTTVMSPEVLVGAGIPCCRLVQNAGDFVVTFPGAYHMGFSHGFNCGEAANIATPEWLRFAKEAALRRASINYPPMVSHFQLLYALALPLCKRMPIGDGSEPRSSRLKDKMKGEGEEMIKNAFVQSVIQNNNLLNNLLDIGASCVVLLRKTPESPLYSNHHGRFKLKPRLSLGLCSHQEALEASRLLPSTDVGPGWNTRIRDFNNLFPEGNSSAENGKVISSGTHNKLTGADLHSSSDSQNLESEKEGILQDDGLLDQGLLACVTCGILSFSCVAVIQPRETTAKYLMSADCGFLNEHVIGSGEVSALGTDTDCKASRNNLVKDIVQVSDQSIEMFSEITCPRGASALELLASVYADTSDIEDQDVQCEKSMCSDKNDVKDSFRCAVASQMLGSAEIAHVETYLHLVGADSQIGISSQSSQSADISENLNGHTDDVADDKCQLKSVLSSAYQPENGEIVNTSDLEDNNVKAASSTSMKFVGEPSVISFNELDNSCQNDRAAEIFCSKLKIGKQASVSADLLVKRDICGNRIVQANNALMHPEIRNAVPPVTSSTLLDMKRSDKDSSRMHVFCLQHAAQVEKQLQSVGGVHMMLLCHPDYPKIESEAKSLAKELGIGYIWKNVKYRDADKDDEEKIKEALEDEEVMPTNSDWSVKLGINLYYTANLSKSPLYSKQLPYNPVVYKAFGFISTDNSLVKKKDSRKRPGRQKKIIVAGRWCGKVWMSNQVHPYLAHNEENQEQEETEELFSLDADQKPLIEMNIDRSSKLSYKTNPSGSNVEAKSSGKKRKKKPLKKAQSKKPRCTMAERNSKTEDACAGTSTPPLGRTLRSKHTKCSENTSLLKSSLKDESGGPSTRLRKRSSTSKEPKNKLAIKKQSKKRKAKSSQSSDLATKDQEEQYTCDIEGCCMSFSTKQDLSLHKRDICPVKGCGKKFFSHKYLVQHRKVHMDDRPLVCPWKGCKMTFKWPWARTEHIRVHTGDRPYVCSESGCGQTFRFVSDFSRHKRKTGHSVKKGRR
ncbi:lysine-specific demethylase REF6-like isoform X1 [Canna indica]|uniref:Lysine-specific demethylase REF6-like isoform X1 n=1 Tax=Canna indica TaxID=4628 RepID=A0AAQ3QB88_9LILI|nr:lysine-specific demethylase REF6-like isoform X1 [Canna indica]